MKRIILMAMLVLGFTVLSPATTQAMTGAYAGLGDSVAAGAGLSEIDPLCGRATQSYPYIVGQSVGIPLHHLACTGAKADEGVYDEQERSGTTIPAQLDEAFVNGTPALISLTIGANDARWTQFIRQCYYIRCGYDVDTARFATYVADLKLELNVVMAKIHSRSNGTPPPVIVTGYYHPFSTQSCSITDNLTASELSWLSTRTEKLNDAIKGTVSKYSYAHFAPVSFAGHELCSADPWVQGPDGIVPFHPTAAGQQAIASAVVTQYNTIPEPTTPLSYRERILNWYQRFSQ
jgi:lysophospholipase L1-like esterase